MNPKKLKDTDCLTCENARNNFTPKGWVPCAHCRPVEYAKTKAAS